MKEKPQNQTILQFHIFLTIQFFFFFLKLTSIRDLRHRSRVMTLSYGNRIGGVIVSVLVSSAVDRGFEPQVKPKTM
jgi:hypothetical protein